MRETLVILGAIFVVLILGCNSGGDSDLSISTGDGTGVDITLPATTDQPTSGSDTTSGDPINTGDTPTGFEEPPTATGPESTGTPATAPEETDPVSTNMDDKDSDGFAAAIDCNDNDAKVNPGAEEIPGNGVDDNCNKLIDETVDTGAACAEAPMPIEAGPVRLMILQDVSGSMTEVPNGATLTKWEQSKAALIALLSNPNNSDIEFGYDSFPSDNYSGVGGTSVKIDSTPNGASQIIAMLEPLTLTSGGQTPLCLAMRNFDTAVKPKYAPKFSAPGASRYLLIVSDGDDNVVGPNCGSLLFPAALPAFKKRTATLLTEGVKTMVIGFGQGAEGSKQLTTIAQAGGTTYNDFMQASDQASLQAALDTMVSTIVPCDFTPKPASGTADPDLINVSFDNVKLKYNPGCAAGDGWTWSDASKTSLNFCPDSCAALKAAPTTVVKATYGCPADAT